jgi:hypothetical protein
VSGSGSAVAINTWNPRVLSVVSEREGDARPAVGVRCVMSCVMLEWLCSEPWGHASQACVAVMMAVLSPVVTLHVMLV